jgi:hypothetical protein
LYILTYWKFCAGSGIFVLEARENVGAGINKDCGFAIKALKCHIFLPITCEKKGFQKGIIYSLKIKYYTDFK